MTAPAHSACVHSWVCPEDVPRTSESDVVSDGG
jgi:hypothetical protein